MNSNIKYIIIGIVVLLTAFFIGRWASPKETKIIKTTIPAISGKSPIFEGTERNQNRENFF